MHAPPPTHAAEASYSTHIAAVESLINIFDQDMDTYMVQ
jgi:hypothetical protein